MSCPCFQKLSPYTLYRYYILLEIMCLTEFLCCYYLQRVNVLRGPLQHYQIIAECTELSATALHWGVVRAALAPSAPRHSPGALRGSLTRSRRCHSRWRQVQSCWCDLSHLQGLFHYPGNSAIIIINTVLECSRLR